ncbi:MAG: ATP-binding protein [Eubacteriaceae bacterium]|nr:ATP-binding protein [Eubacteriaceae bacterium]MDD4507699.1 ATP-binding protein [Eubacteriaceae bacterium]
MFKEIKRQITLFNTLILIAFLLIFILLLVFLVQWSLNLSGEMYLSQVAQSVKNGDDGALKKESVPKNTIVHNDIGYEYIIWDSNHNVEQMKIKNNSLIMQGYEYDLKSDFNDDYKIFNLDDVSYRIYSIKMNENNQEKTLQVFQEITTEQSVIRYIVFFLLFIGCGGILLLIPISYFLAGKSLQPIKETFENQKKFIADASHELRTPLTVIQTNVEVLKLKEDEVLSDNLRWLNNISVESETMSKLVSELLNIAQADNKKIVLERKVFDLSALCAEIIDLMFDIALEKDITLKAEIQENVDYKGDEEKIKQAIRILVDNAIKYTAKNGVVSLKLMESLRSVCISVKDNGVGLSNEDQKKIFSRFYRVDDARNHKTGGFGLGLNIADMVVKQHNGKIKIESELNVGSTFTIVLPKTTLK